MATKDVHLIIKDIQKAYGVKHYRTRSGMEVGGFKPTITKITTPNDAILITGYRYFSKKKILDDIVGAYNHLSRTTYLWNPVDKEITLIRKGRIEYHGDCPVRVTNYQTFLMNIYMRRI